MTPQVHDKLKSTTARYETLLALVGEAAVQADPPTYRKHTIEMAELEPLVEGYRRHTPALHRAGRGTGDGRVW